MIDWLRFELFIMDLVVTEKCETAEDYENIAQKIHEHVENAIQDLCMDDDIEDYSPSY